MCLVTQMCLSVCNSEDHGQPEFSIHGDSPGKTIGIPNPETEPRSPTVHADSLVSKPPGKSRKRRDMVKRLLCLEVLV